MSETLTEAMMQLRQTRRSDVLAEIVEGVLEKQTMLSRQVRYVASQAIIEALTPHIINIARSAADAVRMGGAEDA